jgi:hypothetical protein
VRKGGDGQHTADISGILVPSLAACDVFSTSSRKRWHSAHRVSQVQEGGRTLRPLVGVGVRVLLGVGRGLCGTHCVEQGICWFSESERRDAPRTSAGGDDKTRPGDYAMLHKDVLGKANKHGSLTDASGRDAQSTHLPAV